MAKKTFSIASAIAEIAAIEEVGMTSEQVKAALTPRAKSLHWFKEGVLPSSEEVVFTPKSISAEMVQPDDLNQKPFLVAKLIGTTSEGERSLSLNAVNAALDSDKEFTQLTLSDPVLVDEFKAREWADGEVYGKFSYTIS